MYMHIHVCLHVHTSVFVHVRDLYVHAYMCSAYIMHLFLLQKVFDDLFSEDEHARRWRRGDVRLSYRALQGALMIFLYRCIAIAM